MEQKQLKSIEQKINDLIRICDQLNDENRLLKTKEESWASERSSLREKNEQAKLKVEAMISRLKALEQNS